ncbi:hypothetical protein [Chryseobacterium sp. EO14]|uniref:hypothetical protein n=1 Tax=Chryseobacterium sp. EO14 TaxID=2950551 RepID=UPI00210A2A14|nr:hypothetical protein [Chryseobacterium sp. EO14]MCQ4140509.1 hypothetical protein [Chryseobacterium sp. EO14]
MNYNTKNIFVLFALFISVIIVSRKTTKDSLTDYEISAKVINIYRDKNEHHFLFVKYSDDRVELLDYPYKLGDSISKKKGDSIEYIFRGDKIIQNNLFEKARKEKILK